MRTAAILGMALAAVSFGKDRVMVCAGGSDDPMTLALAEGRASKMFATADIDIQWKPLTHCPASAIHVEMTEHESSTNHPGALAYATPYEGSSIVVFYDRIQAIAERPSWIPVLAHVLVHEITHILQGVCRHSDTGVMKPVFTQKDRSGMGFRALPFAPEDIRLLHEGLAHRQQQQLAAR